MIVLSGLSAFSQPALSSNPSDSSTSFNVLSISKTVDLNAAPATVWKMTGGYNHLDVWHPVVVASELKGEATEPGTLRVLTLGNGAKLTEELVSHSNSARTYSYTILESPLPVTNYTATLTVIDAGEGKTRVKWEAIFNAAENATDGDAVKAITGIFEGGLNNLAKHFNN